MFLGDIEFSISQQSKRRKRKPKEKTLEKEDKQGKKEVSTEKESTENDDQEDKAADTEGPNNEEDVNDSVETAELSELNFMFKHQEIVMVCHEMLSDPDIKAYIEGETPAQKAVSNIFVSTIFVKARHS